MPALSHRQTSNRDVPEAAGGNLTYPQKSDIVATCQVYKLLELPTVYHFSSIFIHPSQRPCPMGYTPQNFHVLVSTWQLLQRIAAARLP
jgi:hypothetical protein